MSSIDTSGEVWMEPVPLGDIMRWSDLLPFYQGFVRAALEAWNLSQDTAATGLGCWGFRHLSGSALARMLEDCRVMADKLACPLTEQDGGAFWRKFMSAKYRLYLTPDGKIEVEDAK